MEETALKEISRAIPAQIQSRLFAARLPRLCARRYFACRKGEWRWNDSSVFVTAGRRLNGGWLPSFVLPRNGLI
jgi:hypothetical protein